MNSTFQSSSSAWFLLQTPEHMMRCFVPVPCPLSSHLGLTLCGQDKVEHDRGRMSLLEVASVISDRQSLGMGPLSSVRSPAFTPADLSKSEALLSGSLWPLFPFIWIYFFFSFLFCFRKSASRIQSNRKTYLEPCLEVTKDSPSVREGSPSPALQPFPSHLESMFYGVCSMAFSFACFFP